MTHYQQPVKRSPQGPIPVQPRFLVRGEVIFVPLPQTLSPDDDTLVTHKTRPVVVLNKNVTYKITADGQLVSPFSFIGLPGTSKDYVVAGRPFTAISIPPRNITTYMHTDGARTVCMNELPPRASYHLKPPELATMLEGLDSVLRPEASFYRRRFFSDKLAEGKMWIIKTHGDEQERQALILLRRGHFFMGDTGEDAPPPDVHPRTRYAPYLMAVFQTAERVTNMRGIGWNDIQILAVQERSFVRQAGAMEKETVSAILNNLRQQVGLKPIDFKSPSIRDAATTFNYISRLALMTFRR